ncbi:MAG: sulfatase [Planctomycetota bacterium]
MQPNVVLIVGEDTGRLLGCYGDHYAKTPNLDRLASQGCRFDQAWTTSPVCAPSRAAMVTGQFPTKIGTHQMRSKLINPPRLFTQDLQDAGYYVSWPTKLDFNFKEPDGWVNDRDPWIDRLREGSLGDGKPFFAFVNLNETHESGMWPVGTFAPEVGHPVEKPRSPAVSDPDEAPVPPYLPDVPAVREDIARHYDNIHKIDKDVGEILDALDASGKADDTIVLFIADHGRGLPREKRWPYPAGLHMPMIVRWPGHLDAGSFRHDLVSWVDFAPTFNNLAGKEPSPDHDGRVFLGESTQPGHDVVFGARDRMDESFDRVRSCTDGRWHYVRNFFPQLPCAQRNRYMELMPTVKTMRQMNHEGTLKGPAALFMQRSKPAEELYDLQTDYACVRNLADNPARAGILKRLSERMDRWLEEKPDMGAIKERDLIARGIVEDQFPGISERRGDLPEPYRSETQKSVMEEDEVPPM